MARAKQQAAALPEEDAAEIEVKDDIPTVEIVEKKPEPAPKEGPWYPIGDDEDDDWQAEVRNILAPGIRRVMIRFRDRKTKKLLPFVSEQDGMHFHLSEKAFTR